MLREIILFKISSKILFLILDKILAAIISSSLKTVCHSVLVAQTIIIRIFQVHLICAILNLAIIKFSHVSRSLSDFIILRGHVTVTFFEVIFHRVLFVINLIKIFFLTFVNHKLILLAFR